MSVLLPLVIAAACLLALVVALYFSPLKRYLSHLKYAAPTAKIFCKATEAQKKKKNSSALGKVSHDDETVVATEIVAKGEADSGVVKKKTAAPSSSWRGNIMSSGGGVAKVHIDPPEDATPAPEAEIGPSTLDEIPAELSVYFDCVDDVRNFVKESQAVRQNRPPPPSRKPPTLPPITTDRRLTPLPSLLPSDNNKPPDGGLAPLNLTSQLLGNEPVETFEQLVDRQLPTPSKNSSAASADYLKAQSPHVVAKERTTAHAAKERSPAMPTTTTTAPLSLEIPSRGEEKESLHPDGTRFSPLPELPSNNTMATNAGSIHNFLDELEEALNYGHKSDSVPRELNTIPDDDIPDLADSDDKTTKIEKTPIRRFSTQYEDTNDIVDDDDNFSYVSQTRRRAPLVVHDADGESDIDLNSLAAGSRLGIAAQPTPIRKVWGDTSADPPNTKSP